MPKLAATNSSVFVELKQAFDLSKLTSEQLSFKIQDEQGVDISDRAIRDFFGKEPGKASMLKKNIDALFQVLMNISYPEACDRIGVDLFDESLTGRYKKHIYDKCGEIHILDMARPVSLPNVYTETRFLSSLRRRLERRMECSFQAQQNQEEFISNSYSSKDVIEKNSRLMVRNCSRA